LGITDSDTNLSGAYRCYGREFIYDIENGNVSVELEFSNTTFSILNEIAKEQNESVSLQKYMQGSTNIYCVPFSENIDSSNAGYLWFYLPEESVAVNRLKLNFNMENYRADAKSITSAPNFESKVVTWTNGSAALLKSNFTTTTGVVRNLSFTSADKFVRNFNMSTTSGFVKNMSYTTDYFYDSLTSSTTFLRTSGTTYTYNPQKFVDDWNVKYPLIDVFGSTTRCSDIGTYSQPGGSVHFVGSTSAPYKGSGITGGNTSPAVNSITASFQSLYTGYSSDLSTCLTGYSFSSSDGILSGYTSWTWTYPIYIRGRAGNGANMEKIVVSATFNNGYADSTTLNNIPIQRSSDNFNWTTIGYLNGTVDTYDSLTVKIEESNIYSNYYYRIYIANSGQYNANRTTYPDYSTITLDIKTYYYTIDDLSYGIIKNNSEFTPPGTIDLYIAKDGDSEELIGQYDSNQKNLNISNPTSSWIWEPGNWYYLKFDSSDSDNDSFGGRMRIMSNLYIQLYLNSR